MMKHSFIVAATGSLAASVQAIPNPGVVVALLAKRLAAGR
jgi:hypothetical protein